MFFFQASVEEYYDKGVLENSSGTHQVATKNSVHLYAADR